MATVIIRPTSDSSSFCFLNSDDTSTNMYSYVDEVSASDLDYVDTASNLKGDPCYLLFGFENVSLGGNAINKITLHTRMKGLLGSNQSSDYNRIYTNSNTYDYSITYTNDYADYTKELTLNPQTSSAWTESEVNALLFGVYCVGADGYKPNSQYFSQFYITVDYGSIPQSSSPSASPSASYSPSVSPSSSPSSSYSPSISPSSSNSSSISRSPSSSPSRSASSSYSPSVSASASYSQSVSPSASYSPSKSPSKSPSQSPSASYSPSSSSSASPSIGGSSISSSPSASYSPSKSPSASPSVSPSLSPSASTSASSSPSKSPSISPSQSPSRSESASISPSKSPSQSPSVSPSSSASASPSSMIEGNTKSDGTGIDISKNLYIKNFYAFAKDVKFTVDNQSGMDGYVTSISIRGDIARVTQAIQVEVQDDESIQIYGDQILTIENDYILNETYAQNLANDKLFNLKDPLTKIHMETVGIPYLQLGDVVTVPENFGTNTQNLFIKKKRWQLLEDGDYVEYLDLQSKTLASWFLLDQSILDGTDVLSE